MTYYNVELVGFMACIKSHLYLEIIKDLKMSTKMSVKSFIELFTLLKPSLGAMSDTKNLDRRIAWWLF